MPQHNKIKQFIPTDKNPRFPGVFGWGFEAEGFRFVVYGPPEGDSPELLNKKSDKKALPASLDEECNAEIDRKSYRREIQKQRAKYNQPTTARRSDHPPAHIHVIHIKSNRENRYELLESDDGHHTARLMQPSINENGQISNRAQKARQEQIKEKHNNNIQKILDETAPLFIQAWRELYTGELYSDEQQKTGHEIFDRQYNRYVTRIRHIQDRETGKIFPIEERINGHGAIELTENSIHIMTIPCSKENQEPLSFMKISPRSRE